MLYEGTITGDAPDRVSGVEARVHRQGVEDSGVASQPFLGLLTIQLEYRGAEGREAYEFVNRNQNDGESGTTIGAAKWTIKTSGNHRVLEVAPVPRAPYGRTITGQVVAGIFG